MRGRTTVREGMRTLARGRTFIILDSRNYKLNKGREKRRKSSGEVPSEDFSFRSLAASPFLHFPYSPSFTHAMLAIRSSARRAAFQVSNPLDAYRSPQLLTTQTSPLSQTPQTRAYAAPSSGSTPVFKGNKAANVRSFPLVPPQSPRALQLTHDLSLANRANTTSPSSLETVSLLLLSPCSPYLTPHAQVSDLRSASRSSRSSRRPRFGLPPSCWCSCSPTLDYAGSHSVGGGLGHPCPRWRHLDHPRERDCEHQEEHGRAQGTSCYSQYVPSSLQLLLPLHYHPSEPR